MVYPNTGGMSVAVDTPMNLPEHRRPPEFGGTGRDSVFQYDTDNLPEGLQFRQNTSTHAFIEPDKPMKISVFEELLAGTKPDWDQL